MHVDQCKKKLIYWYFINSCNFREAGVGKGEVIQRRKAREYDGVLLR